MDRQGTNRGPVGIFRCNHCGMTLPRRCDLRKHEKKHTRPWKCPVESCKYHQLGFRHRAECERHFNDMHSLSPSMWACESCPRQFKRKSNLHQHMEKEHGWNYVRSRGNDKAAREEDAASSAVQQPLPTPSVEPAVFPQATHPAHAADLAALPTPATDLAGFPPTPATPVTGMAESLYGPDAQYPANATFEFADPPIQLGGEDFQLFPESSYFEDQMAHLSSQPLDASTCNTTMRQGELMYPPPSSLAGLGYDAWA